MASVGGVLWETLRAAGAGEKRREKKLEEQLWQEGQKHLDSLP